MGGINTGAPYLGMHVKYTVAVPEKYVVSIDMVPLPKENIIVQRNGTAQTRSSESEKKKKKSQMKGFCSRQCRPQK